jgi:hypothetical protein
MRLENGWPFGLVVLVFGCASPHTPGTSPPAPTPSNPAPPASAPSSWTFSILPGTTTYRIARSGVIENASDSTSSREVTANSSHETITLQQLGDTVSFTATVDTFSTTLQGSPDTTQRSVALPFQISGQLVADSIHIANDTLSDRCSTIATALLADIHNLLPRFPRSLYKTSAWTDSTETTSCQSSIPIRSRVGHSYRVAGETHYNEATVLVIERVDSIHASGEGIQQQHRVVLAAFGTGTATYYVDTATGHVVHLTLNQDVDVTVTASGKANHFRQNAKQEFELAR